MFSAMKMQALFYCPWCTAASQITLLPQKQCFWTEIYLCPATGV